MADDAVTTGPGRQSGDIPPGLYLVATPIGAARDITLRALDVLTRATLLVAEDTRTLRHLLAIHGVPLAGRRILASHDHNVEAGLPKILATLKAGGSVAFTSDAGTPLISDPGYGLVRAALAEGFAVHAAPGASAVMVALAISGLPTDRFFFAGFPPSTKAARRAELSGLSGIPGTVVFFESPRRLHALLTDLADTFGADRQAAVCRELTKKFEEVRRGTLLELKTGLEGVTVKGEVVVLVDRAPPQQAGQPTIEAALLKAMQTMTVKDAAAAVAADLGVARRIVYQTALALARA